MEIQKTHIENILFSSKASRMGYLFRYSAIILLFAASIYSLISQNQSLKNFIYLFLAMGAITLIYHELLIRYKRLIISDKRTIVREGILKNHETTIKYSTMTEISIKQGVFGRIFKYGDLTIHTSGVKQGEGMNFNKIANPVKIKNTIEHFMVHGHKV